MLSQKLEVAVSLANEKVRFTGRGRDNLPVTFDYAPPSEMAAATQGWRCCS